MAKNMSSPMISVVMPVYNAEKYIAEAIESILNQTYSDFEFIIIDDGSNDNSYQILQSYAVKDDRIKLYRNDINLKLPKTLNFGIEQAQGKYIARMDADDISLPERFAKQIEFMESHPDVGVCGTWFKEFKDNDINSIVRTSTNHASDTEMLKIQLLFGGCFIAHPTVMIRNTVIHSHRYDISLGGDAEDYELWNRLINLDYKFINIPTVLLHYRKTEKQTSVTSQSGIKSTTFNIIYANYCNHFSMFIDQKDIYSMLFFKHKYYKKINLKTIIALFKHETTLYKIARINVKYSIFEENIFNKFVVSQSWLLNKFFGVR